MIGNNNRNPVPNPHTHPYLNDTHAHHSKAIKVSPPLLEAKIAACDHHGNHVPPPLEISPAPEISQLGRRTCAEDPCDRTKEREKHNCCLGLGRCCASSCSHMGQSDVGNTAIRAAISYPQAWAGNTPFAWLGAFTGRSGTPAHGTKWWAVSLPVRDPSGPQHGEIVAHGHRNLPGKAHLRGGILCSH